MSTDAILTINSPRTKTMQTGYADLPPQFTDPHKARVVVLPVPYDQTSTWIKGADKGPAALIDASAQVELYDIETDTEPHKVGIHTAPPLQTDTDPTKMTRAVQQTITQYLQQNKFTVTLGGEHSVSIGAFQAHTQNFPDLTILQLDAHADLRDQYENSPHNHACVMARAKELAPILQVGIRSMDITEKPALDPKRTFFAQNIHDNNSWFDTALNQLSTNVYLTIDLDVFDPAIMPATGTPEPGGLQWYPTLAFLKHVIQNRNLVGCDLVELCPQPQNKAPDFLAAKLLYKILAYKFAKQ